MLTSKYFIIPALVTALVTPEIILPQENLMTSAVTMLTLPTDVLRQIHDLVHESHEPQQLAEPSVASISASGSWVYANYSMPIESR